MAHLELDVTRTGVVLRHVTPEGVRMGERFNTSRDGLRQAMAAIGQAFHRNEGLTEIRPWVAHADASQRLKWAIESDENAGDRLKALARSL